jgi:muconolactone delta-isomerase
VNVRKASGRPSGAPEIVRTVFEGCCAPPDVATGQTLVDGRWASEAVVTGRLGGVGREEAVMRFLVLSTMREALPPEQVLSLIGSLRTWMWEHRSTGRLVEDFSLAGRNGSCRILDVESHEELTEIMAGFPFGPFSDIEVFPLSDLDAALDSYEEAMTRRIEPV